MRHHLSNLTDNQKVNGKKDILHSTQKQKKEKEKRWKKISSLLFLTLETCESGLQM